MSKILPWVVLALASLGIYYFIQKGFGTAPPPPRPVEVMEVPVDTIATKSPPREPSNPAITFNLPGGGRLDALPGSFTAMMAEFLAAPQPGEKCLAFDKVGFENGSFKLASGAESQLGDLATLLKAYPDVKADIVGYTDDAGDDGKNKTLSRERAKVIKTWLADHGVAPGKMDAKGLGEVNPVASNKTEAGRNMNRRVEVCLKKK
jgi:outer membrane protein OmpA-like peptidoglycan-associated protein